MMNLSIKLIHKACVRSILFQGLQNLLQIPFEIFQSFRVLQRQLASALTDLVISMVLNSEHVHVYMSIYMYMYICI